MPEYLAPGVYVEETSFRAKSIEGVSTSTAGFIGPARYGPISGDPELLISFADFQNIYGDLEDIGTRINYLAHAVRAFFEEGGKRCYVVRVFSRSANNVLSGHAILDSQPGAVPDGVNVVARFPGSMGNMRVTFSLRIGRNIRTNDTLSRSRQNDVVYVDQPLTESTPDNKAPNTFTTDKLFVVKGDGSALNPWKLVPVSTPDAPGDANSELGSASFTGRSVYPVTMSVERQLPRQDGTFSEPLQLGEFSLSKQDDMGLLRMLAPQPSTPYADLTIPIMFVSFQGGNVDDGLTAALDIRTVINKLLNNTTPSFGINQTFDLPAIHLTGGDDGGSPQVTDYEGRDGGFLDLTRSDDFTKAKNGLLAFEAVPGISIVAAPAAIAAGAANNEVLAINKAVISHCETLKYRVAVLDITENQTVTTALDQRNLISSKYAAIYYPWIYVFDPRTGKGGQRLKLPPSGFVAGIYARNDVEHAVFKAPANEVVRLAVDFEQRLSKAHQEALNPEGVNCFRFFEGRGFLLWGARTISTDSEFKYVSVRRYFCYLEDSIERGTQWAVFENNDEMLWAKVRRTIEDFLFNEWKRGGLMGEKPEKAYFVRCDLTTMTQNDLDNGRLVCLIGVAPVKPAEFVIFRIGQWTADTPLNLR